MIPEVNTSNSSAWLNYKLQWQVKTNHMIFQYSTFWPTCIYVSYMCKLFWFLTISDTQLCVEGTAKCSYTASYKNLELSFRRLISFKQIKTCQFKSSLSYTNFQAFKVSTVQIRVCWVLTPCRFTDWHWRFRGTCCLHLQDWKNCVQANTTDSIWI